MKEKNTKKWQCSQKIKKIFFFLIVSMPTIYIQAQCPAVDVPYAENFESATVPSLPACTARENAAGFQPQWVVTNAANARGFTGKYIQNSYISATGSGSNAWFFTRGINLVANTVYKISYDYGNSFMYGGSTGSTTERLKIACGTSASVAGMTLPLMDHPQVSNQRTTYSVNFTPATSGVYYFGFNIYSASNQGFLNVDNITVAANVTPPSPAITNFTSTVRCGASTSLTINGTNLEGATVTIGGTPVTLATNTATQITASISTAMSGPVVVTTAGGTATSATNFTFMLTPAISLSSTTTTVCAGTASNPVTIANGASSYTAYSWSPEEGVTGNSTSGWIFNLTLSTSYILNATNPATGCVRNISHEVEARPSPPIPIIVPSSSPTICEGNNLVITSSANSGNVWSTNATTKNITVTEAGSYTVTVTHQNGCSTTSAPLVVTVKPKPVTPVITASSSLTMCEGNNLVLTSSAPSGNVWSTNATSNSITVTTGGSYTVTVTQNGCSSTSAPVVVTITPKPIPVITASSSLTMCEGNNLVLTSSAPSGNVWSTNATSNSITVTNGGSYTVTVTQNGCSATSVPVVVTVTPKPVAGASLTGNVTLTATPVGQTYQWVNCTTNAPVSGATGATFTATANGSYKVIVTNSSGCKDTSACVNVSKVGLDENNMDIGVSLYPNPTEGNVYVTMTTTENAEVTVFDAQGKVVFTMNNIMNGTVIDMGHTQKGIYLLKVSNTRGTNVFRMVKNN